MSDSAFVVSWIHDQLSDSYAPSYGELQLLTCIIYLKNIKNFNWLIICISIVFFQFNNDVKKENSMKNLIYE